MNADFTLRKYQKLCRAIIEAGYSFVKMRHYLESETPLSNVVILRHDVDRKPENALKMAALEKDLGLSSTYYFRFTKNAFKPAIIKLIAKMGHEIGYHYETLSKTRGNFNRAIKMFELELKEFRKICEIKTISMHGNPLSAWDNRHLWNLYDYAKFDLVGEAYLSIDYYEVAYFSDTGRKWNSRKYNVRDKVNGLELPQIETTNQLIDLFAYSDLNKFCISVHPNRWADSTIEWIREYLFDFTVNQMKRGINLLRS